MKDATERFDHALIEVCRRIEGGGVLMPSGVVHPVGSPLERRLVQAIGRRGYSRGVSR